MGSQPTSKHNEIKRKKEEKQQQKQKQTKETTETQTQQTNQRNTPTNKTDLGRTPKNANATLKRPRVSVLFRCFARLCQKRTPQRNHKTHALGTTHQTEKNK